MVSTPWSDVMLNAALLGEAYLALALMTSAPCKILSEDYFLRLLDNEFFLTLVKAEYFLAFLYGN